MLQFPQRPLEVEQRGRQFLIGLCKKKKKINPTIHLNYPMQFTWLRSVLMIIEYLLFTTTFFYKINLFLYFKVQLLSSCFIAKKT